MQRSMFRAIGITVGYPMVGETAQASHTKIRILPARHYGTNAETVGKWCKRGAADRYDRSARPHQLPALPFQPLMRLEPWASPLWKATEEERAIACSLRRATNFPLDELTFVVTHVLPHLN